MSGFISPLDPNSRKIFSTPIEVPKKEIHTIFDESQGDGDSIIQTQPAEKSKIKLEDLVRKMESLDRILEGYQESIFNLQGSNKKLTQQIDVLTTGTAKHSEEILNLKKDNTELREKLGEETKKNTNLQDEIDKLRLLYAEKIKLLELAYKLAMKENEKFKQTITNLSEKQQLQAEENQQRKDQLDKVEAELAITRRKLKISQEGYQEEHLNVCLKQTEINQKEEQLKNALDKISELENGEPIQILSLKNRISELETANAQSAELLKKIYAVSVGIRIEDVPVNLTEEQLLEKAKESNLYKKSYDKIATTMTENLVIEDGSHSCAQVEIGAYNLIEDRKINIKNIVQLNKIVEQLQNEKDKQSKVIKALQEFVQLQSQ